MKDVNNIANLLHWIELQEAKTEPLIMFRGQAPDWPLPPSIARIPGVTRVLSGYDRWEVLELDIIERFAKYAPPLIQTQPADIEEWLVWAQHTEHRPGSLIGLQIH